jgi:integral membrane protein
MSENQLETRDVKNFLLVGKLEGYSYLILLFIAMPLKYFFDIPEAVRITGMLHGVLFVGFIFTIVVLFSNKIFNIKQGFLAFVLSLIPFGTLYLKRLFNL